MPGKMKRTMYNKGRSVYNKGKTVKKKVMVKGADLSSLTTRQQETMKKHSVHHTGKHMKMMANMMKRGKTFTQAHKAAQKKVGR